MTPPRVRSSTAAWSPLNPRAGRSTPGPTGGAADAPAPELRHKPPPVHFEAEGDSGTGLPGEPGEYSPPEVERRTLPGRTIITGRADGDVAAVTIVTPRDVRTLRPSGPAHVLIAVYDGQFFSGRITATVLLRNGKRVTEQIPDSTNVQAEAPPEPSLASWLQSTRRQLREWHGPHARPRQGRGRLPAAAGEPEGDRRRGSPSSTPTRACCRKREASQSDLAPQRTAAVPLGPRRA